VKRILLSYTGNTQKKNKYFGLRVKPALVLIVLAVLIMSPPIHTGAADYTFSAKDNDDFYRSTLYEDVYGSAYNYGGQNAIDFYDTSLLPGILSPTPQTAQTTGGLAIEALLPYGIYGYGAIAGSSSDFTSTISWDTAFTPASDLIRSDGSIGTLIIPSLSINMKAYEGTASTSMAKGVGHFTETSGWLGNVGLCGHNRNSRYVIGSIKNLKIGDIIDYSTVLGTRRYTVTFVGTISATDWSYLAPTPDNRITLITCLANQPTLRVCVQAIENK